VTVPAPGKSKVCSVQTAAPVAEQTGKPVPASDWLTVPGVAQNFATYFPGVAYLASVQVVCAAPQVDMAMYDPFHEAIPPV
jgi:hypothetical protein